MVRVVHPHVNDVISIDSVVIFTSVAGPEERKYLDVGNNLRYHIKSHRLHII